MEFLDAGLAESTVRNHVRARKRALGLIQRETFVPQSYVRGHEPQVDCYDAWTDIGGERTMIQVVPMQSMAIGVAFHRGHLHGHSRRSGRLTSTQSPPWTVSKRCAGDAAF